MYRCLCGSVFEHPNILRETARCGGFPRRETYLLCPHCGLGEQYFDAIAEENFANAEEGDDDDVRDPAPDSPPR